MAFQINKSNKNARVWFCNLLWDDDPNCRMMNINLSHARWQLLSVMATIWWKWRVVETLWRIVSLCCGDLDGPPVPEELLLWKNDTAVHGVNLCCTFESSWHHGSPYTFPFDIFWSAHEQGKSCVIWLSGVSKSLGFASWRKHFGDRCMASAHAQAFLSTCPKRPGRQFLWCVRT